MENDPPIALVTGASSGIGLELAKLFARDSYGLVLVGRSGDALARAAKEVASSGATLVRTITKDLSMPDAAEEVFAALEGAHVDVLVNNAGVGLYGPFLEVPAAAEAAMMRLNMIALTQLTKLVAAKMATQRRGTILNVASTAAFQPGPLMAVYYASKAYVLSFSEALASELASVGIRVSVLCPGPTRTGFQQRAKMERSRLFDFGVMDADVVARVAYRGLKRNKRIIIPGIRNKAMAAAVRFAPRRLLPYIVMQIQKPHGERRAAENNTR